MNNNENINWREMVAAFSSYEGTLGTFCNANHITKSQFHYYKKKFKNYDGKKVEQNIENINENLLNKIYEYLVKNLFTLRIEDNLGVYTVKEFIEVWSIIYYSSVNTIANKNYLSINRMSKYIQDNSFHIKSLFDVIGEYIIDHIVGKNDSFK